MAEQLRDNGQRYEVRVTRPGCEEKAVAWYDDMPRAKNHSMRVRLKTRSTLKEQPKSCIVDRTTGEVLE